MGYKKVQLESDSQGLVNGNNHEIDNPEFGSLAAKCRLLLHHHPFYKVSWIRRNSNRVVYELAWCSRGLAFTFLR
ncbi:hypothetical protein LINGRAHAP2_LOCUS10569, partial [Linum grandiflorum]